MRAASWPASAARSATKHATCAEQWAAMLWTTHLLCVQATMQPHESFVPRAGGSLALGKQSMGDSSSLGFRVHEGARLERQRHEASGAARAAGRRPGLRADVRGRAEQAAGGPEGGDKQQRGHVAAPPAIARTYVTD